MGADKDRDDEWEPDTCQYRGYRNGPDHPNDPYGLSPQYWHVFAARLAFVVVFEVKKKLFIAFFFGKIKFQLLGNSTEKLRFVSAHSVCTHWYYGICNTRCTVGDQNTNTKRTTSIQRG